MKKWEEWGITEDHHKFICLRWEEIFSEDTYDSWQIRTANFRSILLEMLEAVTATASFHPFHRNIKHLIEEAKLFAKIDPIIPKHFPYIRNHLNQLEQCYVSEISTEKKNSLLKFKRIVYIIIEHINPYKELLIKRLTDLISGSPGCDNTELYKLIMALGIVLRSEGYSIAFLRNSFNILIDNSIPNFGDRFYKLISVFSSEEIEYECSFHIITTREDINLEKYGMTFHTTRPDRSLTDVESQFYDQDSDPYRISVRIRALDPYAARAAAENSVENLFAAYNFYQPNRYPKFKHKLSLIVSKTGDQICLEKDDSRLRYIRDSKKPRKSISSLMNLVGQMPEPNAGELTASLQYHRLAMDTHTYEARLINLWIAMESLVQGDRGSIIDIVCKYIPTSIGLEYVLQTIKNLAISMREIWRDAEKGELLTQLKYSDKYRLHQIDLLGILMEDINSEKVKKLKAIVAQSPLLRYRFFSLWKNMFKSPKILSKKIRRHRVNIEWQLCRIYRARNYIMHIGVRPPKIRQLIQHLHSYYILVMHGIIHDLKNHNQWGIEHAFENRLLLYDMLISGLNDYDSNPLTVEELLYPSRMLVRNDGSERHPAWVTQKDSG